ncbi:hypothetical protein [Rhodococcus sp. SJ-2]
MNMNNTPQPDERVRAQKCLERRLRGDTYQQIADELGYADRSGARKAIEALLARQEYEAVAEYRTVQVFRLEEEHRIQFKALQDLVTLGKLEAIPPAISSLVKISDRLSKLLGLDAPQKLAVAPVPADSEDFAVTAARLIAEIQEAEAQPLPDFLTSGSEAESEPWVNT